MVFKKMNEADMAAATRELKDLYGIADISTERQPQHIKWLLKDGTFLKAAYDKAQFHADIYDCDVIQQHLTDNETHYADPTIKDIKVMGNELGAMHVTPLEKTGFYLFALVQPPTEQQIKALYQFGSREKIRLTTVDSTDRKKASFTPENIDLRGLKEECNALFEYRGAKR